jgi:hypothetical protein
MVSQFWRFTPQKIPKMKNIMTTKVTSLRTISRTGGTLALSDL